MLKALFGWFDGHPGSYWVMAAVPTLVWAAWIAAGLRRTPDSQPRRAERIAFALLLFGVLLAWRWPFLLDAHQMNPDESQFLAGAITLQHDPVFWRSVDGTTSGPLNYYALLPTHLLGVPQDYFNARLTGLLLVWGGLLACHGLLAAAFGAPLARLGMVPGVVFFAAATDTDFIHYSSEHVSLLLMPLGWYLLWRNREPPSDGRPTAGWLAAGFTAGLLPWAKLQSAPFAALLVAGGIWLALRSSAISRADRIRRAGWLLLAAAAPGVVGLLAVTAAGQSRDFFLSYLAQNFTYMGETPMTLGTTVKELARLSRFTWQFPVFLVGPCLVIAAGAAVGWRQRRRPGLLFWAGGALTLVAGFAILAPRRGFHHYLLFLVLPLTLWSAAAVGDLWQNVRAGAARRWLMAALVIAAGLLPLGQRLRLPVPYMFGQFAEHWRHPYSDLGHWLRMHARPGDTLAMWGWCPSLYVETALPQGTREAHSYWQIRPSALRAYYRERYLADLERNPPTFFVDAVGPGAFSFIDRPREAHETWPELEEYVRCNYLFLREDGQARTYLRADRLSAIP
jgi:hypothetical protein